jgi:hypothetical protein
MGIKPYLPTARRRRRSKKSWTPLVLTISPLTSGLTHFQPQKLLQNLLPKRCMTPKKLKRSQFKGFNLPSKTCTNLLKKKFKELLILFNNRRKKSPREVTTPISSHNHPLTKTKYNGMEHQIWVRAFRQLKPRRFTTIKLIQQNCKILTLNGMQKSRLKVDLTLRTLMLTKTAFWKTLTPLNQCQVPWRSKRQEWKLASMTAKTAKTVAHFL